MNGNVTLETRRDEDKSSIKVNLDVYLLLQTLDWNIPTQFSAFLIIQDAD